jgi:hypothetical protein
LNFKKVIFVIVVGGYYIGNKKVAWHSDIKFSGGRATKLKKSFLSSLLAVTTLGIKRWLGTVTSNLAVAAQPN